MTEKLYTVRDVANMFGVTSSAICNSIARKSRSIELPEPAFSYGKTNAPLWTKEQLEQIVEDRIEKMRHIFNN